MRKASVIPTPFRSAALVAAALLDDDLLATVVVIPAVVHAHAVMVMVMTLLDDDGLGHGRRGEAHGDNRGEGETDLTHCVPPVDRFARREPAGCPVVPRLT